MKKGEKSIYSCSEMGNLKKNFLYNITYQLLLIILPLITAPYVSRVLGVDGVGTYSYIYSIAYYFCLFGMLGVSNHGNRSIALVREDRVKRSSTFWAIYTMQFITTMIALLLYLVFITVFFDGNKRVAYIDTLFLLSYVLDINWLFFGLEEFRLTVTRNMAFKILTVVCTFLFVKCADDLWKYTLILALGTLLSQAYLWGYLLKKVDFVRPSKKDLLSQIKPVLVLFIPVIAYSIYKVMDKIMLGSMTSVQQVGLYENAEKIVGIPVGVITAFGTVMMPRISALVSQNNTSQIENYNRMSFRYFSLLAFGMVFGLIGTSGILPEVYFGSQFVDCGPLIAGLSFTLIFMTWANIIRTQYLIPNKKDRPYVVSTICGAMINLVVNYLLIPRFQAKGALIGTLLAEFTVFFVQAIYVRNEFPVYKYLRPAIGFLVCGICMSGAVYQIGILFGRSIKTLFFQVVAGIVIYISMSVICLLFMKDEVLLSTIRKLKRD